jgi:hypothetical protein
MPVLRDQHPKNFVVYDLHVIGLEAIDISSVNGIFVIIDL